MIRLKGVNKYFNKGKRNEIHVINDTTLELEPTGLVALLDRPDQARRLCSTP